MHTLRYWSAILVAFFLSGSSTASLASRPSFPGAHFPARYPVHASHTAVNRAQFNFSPYELTSACLDFNWFDPNSVPENNVSSCTCEYTWDWDGKATTQGADNNFDDTNFVVCTERYPSVFEMRVNAFAGPSNLTLFISHFYKDSSLWGPPYIYAQTYAMAVLNLSLQYSSNRSISYFTKGPVLANITGLTG